MFRRTLVRMFRPTNFTGLRPLRSDKMVDFPPKNTPNQSTCNYKPHIETESVEVFYIYSGILLILGGIAGAGKFGSDTYKKTKHGEYLHCVGETTLMGFTGFGLGMAAIFMSPILVPMGTLVAVVRYFDTEKP